MGSVCPVRSIGWKPGRVEVVTANDRPFHAAAAIITLPLGVLQARRVAFLPQPREILMRLTGIAMGPVARVVYEFDPEVLGPLRQPRRGELRLCSGVHSPYLVDHQPSAELFAYRLGSRPQSWQAEDRRPARDGAGDAGGHFRLFAC